MNSSQTNSHRPTQPPNAQRSTGSSSVRVLDRSQASNSTNRPVNTQRPPQSTVLTRVTQPAPVSKPELPVQTVRTTEDWIAGFGEEAQPENPTQRTVIAQPVQKPPTSAPLPSWANGFGELNFEDTNDDDLTIYSDDFMKSEEVFADEVQPEVKKTTQSQTPHNVELHGPASDPDRKRNTSRVKPVQPPTQTNPQTPPVLPKPLSARTVPRNETDGRGRQASPDVRKSAQQVPQPKPNETRNTETQVEPSVRPKTRTPQNQPPQRFPQPGNTSNARTINKPITNQPAQPRLTGQPRPTGLPRPITQTRYAQPTGPKNPNIMPSIVDEIPNVGKPPVPTVTATKKHKKVERETIALQLRKYQIMLEANDHEKARKEFTELNEKALNNPIGHQSRTIVWMLSAQLAKLFMKAQRHVDAMEILRDGLKIYGSDDEPTLQEINDLSKDQFNILWEMHDDIAVCYAKAGNRELEAKHYKIAIDMLKTTSVPPERYPHMMNNLGNVYKQLGFLNDAKTTLEEAKNIIYLLNLPEEGRGYSESLQKVMASLGNLYMDMGLNDEALREFEELVRGIESGAATVEMATRLYDTKNKLYELYLLAQQYDKADYIAATNVNRLGDFGENDDADKPMNSALKYVEYLRKAQEDQRMQRHPEAVENYQRALKEIEDAGDVFEADSDRKEALSTVHNNLGNAFQTLGGYYEARDHLEKALKIRKSIYGDSGASEELASVHFNLGNLNARMGDERKAVEYYDKSVAIYKRLGADGNTQNTRWLARTYKALGVVYQEMDMTPKAIESYEKAQQLLKEHGGDDTDLQAVTNNLGNAYESIGNYNSAKDTLKESLELVEKMLKKRPNDVGLLNDKCACFNNIGIAYKSAKDFKNAIHYLKQCSELRARLIEEYNSAKAKEDIGGTLCNIAGCYLDQDDPRTAIRYFEEAIEYYERFQQNSGPARVRLSICYEKLGDKQKAVEVLN